MTRLCVDCTFLETDSQGKKMCSRKAIKVVDLVDGSEYETDLIDHYVERANQNGCGSSGHFWKPK